MEKFQGSTQELGFHNICLTPARLQGLCGMPAINLKYTACKVNNSHLVLLVWPLKWIFKIKYTEVLGLKQILCLIPCKGHSEYITMISVHMHLLRF